MTLAAALLWLVAAGAGAALGHATMTASVPGDGATVATGLTQIELTFSHPMRLTLVRVQRGGDAADVALQAPLPKGFVDRADVAVEALPAGAYEVAWTAVSEDGHVMTGRFAFTVAGPAAPAP
jgi:methionine-rich copper-binding protein CopC